MPSGFYTVEQWQRPVASAPGQWLPVLHLDSHESLTRAIQKLEKRGEPGLYRVVQMQRCLWGEMVGGKLKLHGSHASSPSGLDEIVKIYEREGGRRPVEKARQDRLKAKRARKP